MATIHPTKVDWWIRLILWANALICAATAVGAFLRADVGATVFGVILLAIGAMLLALPSVTRYEIELDRLVARCGPIRWIVPLAEIVDIHPTRNPLSAPACSLDRLRIDYEAPNGRRRFVLVSPVDKDEFLRDLVEAAPHLELVGDRIRRKSS